MTVSAPIPGLALATLARWAATQPQAEGAAYATTARQPDLIVFSSTSPLRMLSDLAAAGLRQLATLLPALERAVSSDASPLPLGHLAKAVAAAARQIDEGHDALLDNRPLEAPTTSRDTLRDTARQLGAAYDPFALETDRPDQREALRQTARQIGTPAAVTDMIDRETSTVVSWLTEAKQGLHTAAYLLQQAEQNLNTMSAGPDTLWALSQLAGAQRHVGDTLHRVTTSRLRPAKLPLARPASANIDWVNSAIALFGTMLATLLLWAAAGSWACVGVLVSFAATVAWGWRVAVSTHGVRLELRR